MKNTEINFYEKIGKPQVSKNITLEDWFNLIKHSDFIDKINEARRIGKYTKVGFDNTEYKNLKLSIPCVTYNFRFRNYKKNENIESPTGITYIDIDHTDFDISILKNQKDKILSFYHSFGGIGYVVLVKVNGLNLDNYHNTFYHIVRDLGIEKFVDKEAVKASQYNVLSYDKDIFINYNSTSYEAINNEIAPLSGEYLKPTKNTYIPTTGGQNEFTTNNNQKVKTDNVLDIVDFNGKPFVTNWDGIDVISCFLPFNKIQNGKRDKTLFHYCLNYVFLNPHLSKERVVKTIKKINYKKCAEALDLTEVERIVTTVFGYKNNNRLRPIRKKRFIIFNPLYPEKLDKNKIVREQLIKRKKELSVTNKEHSEGKLFEIIQNWDWVKFGKISQRKIYQNIENGISKKMVERCYPIVKESIMELNEQYKQDKNSKPDLLEDSVFDLF